MDESTTMVEVVHQYQTKYYVDDSGAYLGGFAGAEPPEGAIEVPTAPSDGRDIYKDGAWRPYVDAPAVPQRVTRRQARQALFLSNLLDSVEPAIAAIPDLKHRRLAQIEWEDSLEFERNRPLVVSISTALGLTEPQLDELFVAASKL